MNNFNKQKEKPQKIIEIASKIGLTESELEFYGSYKAKIIKKIATKKKGKLILVTAMSPTPSGEGKTTVSIGLADSLNALGYKCILALREPSLGPVFGLKGGASGGGKCQLFPSSDINLHFTGDLHAITTANNLLVALLENHLYHGNALNIDTNKIVFKRCLDISDRSLRHILTSYGGKDEHVSGFEITAASEIMAILCLASSRNDLKRRLGKIVVAYSKDNKPISADMLKATGSLCVLLKDAFYPNLVQTIYGSPTLIHGGPFANIAHGCSSLLASKLGLSLADYVVTEAGFGADLGAEKFCDIKCRIGKLEPYCSVLVVSIKALKFHGGLKKEALSSLNVEALEKGFSNLLRHYNNLTKVFGLKTIVAINEFNEDKQAEKDRLINLLLVNKMPYVFSKGYQLGPQGNKDLALAISKIKNKESYFKYAYPLSLKPLNKIKVIAKEIYHAKDVTFSPKASAKLANLAKNYPICLAKTPFSFSDDKNLIGVAENFSLHVDDIEVKEGAEFIVVYCGSILTLPGLPLKPAAENIDLDEKENIIGLF